MSKKGSALMQVIVVGLIVAAFSVLMLRYAVTRSSNLSRTERILEADIVADSCLDQYMAFQAIMELYGKPVCDNNFMLNCVTMMTSTDTIHMNAAWGTNEQTNKDKLIVTFDVPQ